MTTNDAPRPSQTPTDEQLTSYLDGELDIEQRRGIEELLASNADVRRRVQEMERTWDLLDGLDAAPVGDQFAQSTLEMVALAARDDVEQIAQQTPVYRCFRVLGLAAIVLVTAALGFAAVILFRPDPNRPLLDDLFLLEHFDQYRQVGDIEFLRMLRKEKLFLSGSTGVSENEASGANESRERRLQRIQSMSPSQLEEIVRLQERFGYLDVRQQQELRRLDQEFQKAPDSPQLLQIMGRYCQWLKAFSSYTRAELAEMNAVERLKAVKKRLDDQAREQRQRVSEKDLETLRAWVRDCAERYEAQFLKTMSSQQRKKYADLSPAERQRWMFWQLMQATATGKATSLLTVADLARLRMDLSPELRKQLDAIPATKQWPLVAAWLRHLMKQHLGSKPEQRPAVKIDDEQLVQFFEHQLSDQERDRLLSLPGEEMQRELQRLYRMRLEGGGRRPEGPKHGKQSGADRSATKKSERAAKTDAKAVPKKKP